MAAAPLDHIPPHLEHGPTAAAAAGEGGALRLRPDEGRVAGQEERAQVGVLALICRHDDSRIGVRPLHSLLHTARCAGATIIAPAYIIPEFDKIDDKKH